MQKAEPFWAKKQGNTGAKKSWSRDTKVLIQGTCCRSTVWWPCIASSIHTLSQAGGCFWGKDIINSAFQKLPAVLWASELVFQRNFLLENIRGFFSYMMLQAPACYVVILGTRMRGKEVLSYNVNWVYCCLAEYFGSLLWQSLCHNTFLCLEPGQTINLGGCRDMYNATAAPTVGRQMHPWLPTECGRFRQR